MEQFLLVLILLIAAFAALTFLKGASTVKTFSFGFTLLGFTGWLISLYLSRQNFAYAGTMILYSESAIMVALYIFSRSFPNRLSSPEFTDNSRLNRFMQRTALDSLLLFLPLAVFLLLLPLPMVIQEIRAGSYLVVVGGPLFRYFIFLQFIYVLAILFNFYRQFQSTSGLKRQRLLYFIVALVAILFYNGLISIQAVIENVKHISFLSMPLSLIFAATGLASVVDLKLMDLRHFLRIIVVNGLSFAVTYLVFILVYEQHIVSDIARVILLISFSLLSFAFSRTVFDNLVSRYVWPKYLSFQGKLNNLAEQASLSLKPKEIIDLCLPVFKETLDFNWICFYDLQKKKIFFDINERRSLPNLDPKFLKSTEFVEALKQVQYRYLITGEVPKPLRRLNVFGFLPLREGGEITGVFIIGPQVGLYGLSEQQADEFFLIWQHIQTSYAKAKLYEELEKKVEHQVKDIRYKNKKLNDIIKTRMEFIHMTSHQLRTPVTALSSILQLLNAQTLAEDRARELLNLASERVRGLSDLINNILNVARLEKESIQSDVHQTVKLSAVFAAILPVLESQAQHKELRIVFESNEQAVVIGNGSYLEQAFFNIVENAIEHSEGEEVRAFTIDDDNYWIVGIEDTGKGIDASLAPHIFKKHVRSEESKGAGLGLYLSKKIIEAHPKGLLWFENRKEGGVIFYIRLKKAESNEGVV